MWWLSQSTSLAKLHWSAARDVNDWRHHSPYRLAQSAVPNEDTIPAASRVTDNALPAGGDPTANTTEDLRCPKAKYWHAKKKTWQKTEAPWKDPAGDWGNLRQRPDRRQRHLAKDQGNTQLTQTLQFMQHNWLYIMSVPMPGHWCSFHAVQWPMEWQRDNPNNYLVMQEDRSGTVWSTVR